MYKIEIGSSQDAKPYYYIGKTIQTLEKRFKQHMSKLNKFKKYVKKGLIKDEWEMLGKFLTEIEDNDSILKTLLFKPEFEQIIDKTLSPCTIINNMFTTNHGNKGPRKHKKVDDEVTTLERGARDPFVPNHPLNTFLKIEVVHDIYADSKEELEINCMYYESQYIKEYNDIYTGRVINNNIGWRVVSAKKIINE